MQIHTHGMTDRGMTRPINEDALFIDEDHNVFAVADGLGGLPGGAESSSRIVELLAKTFNKVDAAEERVDLAELIIGINRIVTDEGLLAHPSTGSGSTLTISQIIKDQCLIAHVGDSALYLLRDGEFNKVTIDHTMEQEFIERMGEEARSAMPPEYPHTLTRCVGQDQELRVDQTRLSLKSGDRLLLCTDGLNKVLSEATIQSMLSEGNQPDVITKRLIEDANAAGGPDNITLIVLIIE
ncbi:MAG: protein phosphatase 2C domain-containing protein [Opitutales bacterium]|jgi:PPM family protein phosphatase|nr:protein phosphatase 2C domain-containing protein [Opitutales bacterium]MDP4643920.1 protein phosphatase 2C domain-containing protein [Opitutales bacterium]MDP4694069.1 protein phosphatase 2C domain-containing protein [Opitutales bacterium]MDP4777429.1 protein phosphatase 2C domain-containing protein [Opitutales bacterium]MDP4878546.1 protein phosphatase 2C domain-containing protein [Opitutales bacterium]